MRPFLLGGEYKGGGHGEALTSAYFSAFVLADIFYVYIACGEYTGGLCRLHMKRETDEGGVGGNDLGTATWAKRE